MNDLQINYTLGEIAIDLEPLKADLKQIADKYAGIVVSENDIPQAKQDRAELNKIFDGIETQRKNIKKAWNTPYDAFEKQVKEVEKILKEPIEAIDKQIKEFEAAEKKKKEDRCKEIFNEQVSEEYRTYLPYEKVFDQKWTNKSTSEQSIIADISTALTQIRIDLDGIKALGSEIEEQCLEAYKIGGMAAAIKRNSDYLSAKKAAEEQARIEAERKVREEQERKAEQERIEAEKKAQEEKKEEPEEVIEPVKEDLPFTEDLPFPLPTFRFEVSGQENIDKVKQFLEYTGIAYKEI